MYKVANLPVYHFFNSCTAFFSISSVILFIFYKYNRLICASALKRDVYVKNNIPHKINPNNVLFSSLISF